jgi:hypothetical protein
MSLHDKHRKSNPKNLKEESEIKMNQSSLGNKPTKLAAIKTAQSHSRQTRHSSDK